MTLKELMKSPADTYCHRYISNWTYLSSFLACNPDLATLGSLLRLEVEGKRRDFILSRIMGKIHTEIRKKLQEELQDILNEK